VRRGYAFCFYGLLKLLRISLSTRNFPPQAGVANADGELELTWAELVWAAVSVGRGTLSHLHQHGIFSMFEIVYRIAMIYANLLESASGRVVRSSAYEGLDPSEKSAISYFLGLALTKAFVAKRLDVPWLMHVDVYRQQFGLQMIPYGGRPDLFGRSVSGDWIVAESKGRTNWHDSGALERAKTQAQQVTSIAGVAPALRMGLVTSFTNGWLSLFVDDPPTSRTRKPLNYKISDVELKAAYYAPFRALLEANSRRREDIRGRRIDIVRLDSSDLEVGIVEELGADKNPELPLVGSPQFAGDSEFLGIDGIFVRLGSSWGEDRMILEPQTRK